jgi:hypothetical protein
LETAEQVRTRRLIQLTLGAAVAKSVFVRSIAMEISECRVTRSVSTLPGGHVLELSSMV